MSVLFTKFGSLPSDKLLFLARISEASERYDDMALFTTILVKQRYNAAQEISIEERNLLSVAYKNVIATKRVSLRTLQDNVTDENKFICNDYRLLIEDELKHKCLEVLQLLKDYLLIQYDDKGDENQVFYLKMGGDYYRYLSELVLEKENKSEQDLQFFSKAKSFYSKAFEVAKTAISETHPTRLGLVLNYSVCCYEILNEKEKACTLAKEAFDAAINKLDTLSSDASYKDSTLIMQLLRDNLTLWTTELNANHVDHEEDDDDDDDV
mmetsp:Transcript_52901/g.87651  ORF Transcript_52901/g.87651 Transcript_52901/m.87651 type:complete len:267 (-) Transcript_52901:83-883(-)|eukprot:CAMPEP_0202688624 /NCGR_PEP_ID=MMETSP1385-20130828/4114_1 /ASSEMBLY_ACC=CAM_ASM_000861 /TAXON_ID=933848 /ORGANISM="Elphidium margaritaceum" /LENGTH=266 /DNA_ID=CAMNT_0049343643 /DNA_START=29 /DNA_END=829 /DNA_ORIENTATION=+